MALPVFPTLPGLAWPVTRSMSFDTLVQPSVSNRVTAIARRILPRWTWQVSFDVLRSGAGVAEMQTLAAFYASRAGRAMPFAFRDAEDNIATNQLLGIGDGTTRTFQLVRSLGGFIEPVFLLSGPPVIAQDGAVQPSNRYTISPKGVVTFTPPPAAGRVVTWSGGYNWLCRFEEDQVDFSNFMAFLWGVETLSFSSEIA